MRPCVLRIDPDRLAILRDRLVQLTLSVQSMSQIVAGHRKLGLEPDRLPEFGDGFRRLAVAPKGQTQTVVRGRVVRL